jgi:hypothetical protein
MVRSLLSLFSRPRAAEPAAAVGRSRHVHLPASVIAAVESASVIVRPGSREDGPRAIVAFPGRNGWTFSAENAAKCFTAGWPDMTAAQIKQATSRLSCLVHAAMQESAAFADRADTAKRSFIDRY